MKRKLGHKNELLNAAILVSIKLKRVQRSKKFCANKIISKTKSEVLFMIKVPVKSEKKFQRQNIGLEKDWNKFEFFLSINEGVFIPKRTRKEAGSLLMSYLS